MKDFSKNRNYNRCEVDGYVFSHSLEEKVTGEKSKNPGTPYISGKVDVAINEDGTEVIPVFFGYVTEFFGSGKPNDSYTLLKTLIKDNKTVQAVGIEDAKKIRVQGDIEINDFVGRDDTMVEQQRVRGSFAHSMDGAFAGKATFKNDVLINKYREVENDEGENYGVAEGYIFNYRNEFLPVSFNVTPESGGMQYFENCEISSKNPLLTNVWGDIVVNTIVREIETETAFGAPQVSSTTRSFITWNIVGAAGEPYEFGDEEVMTIADVKAGLATREKHLAEVRQRDQERKNGSNSFNSVPNVAPASKAVPAVDDDDDDFSW